MSHNAEPAAPAASALNTKFLVKHAFGCHVTKIDSIQSFSASSGDKESSDRLVYKVGKQVCINDFENGRQEFFDSRNKQVTDVVHFNISSNSRFISMCEKIGEASSHISIYSLSTLNKLKTLNHNSAKSYICSTFCGDPKMIAALTGDTEKQIIIWYWEKEKFYKSVQINTHSMNVNLLRSAPSSAIMLTTTGPSCFKYWSLGVDGSLKAGQFLPPSKEALENFVDHLWLPSALGQHRLIVLADPEVVNDSNRTKKQTLFVFEGSDDNATPAHTGGSSNPVAPINMELKQAISLKLELGGRIEKIIPTSKAFMLVGLFGLVCTYERTDDKHEPYTEARRISLGDVHIIGATVPPSEERAVIIAKTGRMLSMSLDMSIEQLKLGAGLADDGERSMESMDDESNTASLTKDEFKGLAGVSDLETGGFHCQPIISADLAYERPLMVTISADNTARLWNYSTMKCELMHNFRADEPMAVTIHANGFQLLVSFKDRIRMYNILMDKLKMCKETILKNCKCMKFSNGSQYFAAASAINIVIYDTKSFTQLTTFQGHMMTVVRLSWAVGDQVLFSAGMDGNIYGWPIAKEGRIDVIAASNRSSAILDLQVDSPSTVFPVAHKEYEDDAPTAAASTAMSAVNKMVVAIPPRVQERYTLIVSSLDGYIRMPPWSMEASTKAKGHTTGRVGTASSDKIDMLQGDPSVSITAMQLSNDRTRLFCGTSIGSLRVYAWPPAPNHSAPPSSLATGSKDAAHSHPATFYEIFAHSQKVVAIKLTPVDNCVVSAAEDGSVFVHTIVEEVHKGSDKNAAYDPFEVLDDAVALNNEVVLMSTEDIEDHVNEVVELQKMLSETRAKNDFHARKLESDHNEALRKMNEMHDITVNREKESFEKQRATFDKRIRELLATIETKEAEHIKITNELDNKYEHKLADQLERYDMLHEKMQLLKQKCEGLLEAEKSNFQKQLVDLKDAAKSREKALQIKHRRAVEDKSANESAFKEIINQQEDEYEDELRQLIHAAESELVSERETILKLRTLVQTKKTKIDQLEKKLTELSVASKARLVLLNQEKAEKQKLVETIEHYKKNLIEREDALAEKEKMVLELRSTTRTLENFRFVLDHRLQQLSSERGPITSHIEGLEKHISTMYEELVEEFNAKKSSSEAASLKDQKIVWISNDLNKTRQNVREKEQYIAAFKRELGNIVSSMVVGKELEESVKLIYKKFVRGETGAKTFSKTNEQVTEKVDAIMGVGKDGDDQSVLSMDTFDKNNNHSGVKGMRGVSDTVVKEVEEALVETAKEADRQKKFVERQSDNLKHRLSCVKREAHTLGRHRLNENSTLLYECNELRTEVKELRRKLDIKKNELDLASRKVDVLTGQIAYLSKHPGETITSRPTSSKAQKRISEANALLASDPAYTAPLLAGAADTNNWVVHNSLLPKSSSMHHGIGSSGLLHDTAVPYPGHSVTVSHSAPMLEPLRGSTSPLSKRANGKTLPAQDQQPTAVTITASQSTSALHNPLSAPGGAKLISLNIPRANLTPKLKGSRKASVASSVGSDWHVEKLTKEVDSLAVQLDESLRERDMQRIELSRLRKQVMALSVSGAQSHTSFNNASVSNGNSLVMGGNPNNMSLQLPSILAQEPSQVSSSSPHNQSRSLTNADLFGVPSEQDMRDMRLAPSAAVLSSNPSSVKSRNSLRGPAVNRTNSAGSESNKVVRGSKSKGLGENSIEEGGENNLMEFSLQSSMSVQENAED